MPSIHRRQFLQISAAAALAPTLPACSAEQVVIDTSLPVGPFGAKSTAEEVTEGLDLSGKTALVTGCNSGIGYETMRVLARRGAHVIGTGRTLEKAQKACANIEGETTPLALELSDFNSCVDCAEQAAELGKPLDILILNAGIGSFYEFELINGIEKIFVINYLGHVVLTMNLLPLVQAAPSGRIVHVGSQMGYMRTPEGGIDFDNLRGEGEYEASRAYGRSKLANALFSLKLSQMLDPAASTSNVIHPGFVKTNIGRNAKGIAGFFYNRVAPVIQKSVGEGAATQVYVATAPALEGVSGAYFEDCNPVKVVVPNHIFDRELADRLWRETQQMLGNYL
ncbi:MAG: SDR family NAD(P)-dependent oxidoreductase [Halieaceae bacterium]|nr:SDR family NAD(P)-dependent oxidoreductase [Halieaceae bacterium]